MVGDVVLGLAAARPGQARSGQVRSGQQRDEMGEMGEMGDGKLECGRLPV